MLSQFFITQKYLETIPVAARLVGLGELQSRGEHRCLSVVSVMCCQVEFLASG